MTSDSLDGAPEIVKPTLSLFEYCAHGTSSLIEIAREFLSRFSYRFAGVVREGEALHRVSELHE